MKRIIISMLFLGVAISACDNQSPSEKMDASKNNMMRSAHKTMNRLDESTCNEGDIKCFAEKAEHRTEEGADYVKDKSEEAVDNLD